MKKIRVKIAGSDSQVTKMFKDRGGFEIVKDDTTQPIDLLVFTGGPDVDPNLYQEPKISQTSMSKIRDSSDLFLYRRFVETPKVGICRGGQFLNVMNGGKMWQHVDNHVQIHNLINLLESKTSDLAPGDIVSVTSTHHQMMIAGEDGEVVGIAQADDDEEKGLATIYISGIPRNKPKYDTEVVWYEKTKNLCFQPHPEYSIQSCTDYFFDLINHFYR